MTSSDIQIEKSRAVLKHFISEQKLPSEYEGVAQTWFIPLALTLIKHQKSANRPILVGINGCQGSGKSTLTCFLSTLLNEVFKVASVGLSIDDFYLSKHSRQLLASSINPLLATRGVPGTHDIVLLESTLWALRQGQPVSLPMFDKSMDDVKSQEQWEHAEHKYKIIILEGWCVGLDSQHPSQLLMPVNELEAKEDTSGKWRQYVNDVLSIDYKRVFASIDYLVMLQAPSFEHVYAWRCEQEHKLRASLANHRTDSQLPNETMNDSEILRFIQFYQRLTQHALSTIPAKCDRLFVLNETRGITQCQQH